MKKEITLVIRGDKCDHCPSFKDCHRSLREQIECELRNNLTPDIRYKEVAEDGI